MDGIRDVLKDNPRTAWTIVELDNAGTVDAPALVHSWIGRNGWISKLDGFSDVLRRSAGRPFDVALLKFCFVDFSDETDVPDLFRKYTETFAGLKASYPGTTFVHVTVPLTGSPGGLKWIARNVVKRIIGRKVRGPRDNRTINAFNDLLRNRYLGHEPLFDLAALESTHADGSREMVREAGAHPLFARARVHVRRRTPERGRPPDGGARAPEGPRGAAGPELRRPREKRERS